MLRSVTLEVAETDGGVEVRWSTAHNGKDHHGTMRVPPLTAPGFILCQALYQAEALIGELGGADADAPAADPAPTKAAASKLAARQMGLAL